MGEDAGVLRDADVPPPDRQNEDAVSGQLNMVCTPAQSQILYVVIVHYHPSLDNDRC